jgi:hypothetical protein
MAKPLHVQAFEQFKQKYDGDQLKALVAFGLFIESEYKWAKSQPLWPGDGKYKTYHQFQFPHQIDVYDESADRVLFDFVDSLVEDQRKEFLEAALAAFKVEAAKSHHRWWHGVLEATGGALVWSVILIIGAIAAGRLGIDVLGAFERAAAIHHSTPPPNNP